MLPAPSIGPQYRAVHSAVVRRASPVERGRSLFLVLLDGARGDFLAGQVQPVNDLPHRQPVPVR